MPTIQTLDQCYPGDPASHTGFACLSSQGTLIGCLHLRGEGSVVHLSSLYVDAAHRRAGIGRALVTQAIEQAKKSRYPAPDCEAASLVVKQENLAAIGFYRRLGFKVAYAYDNGDLMMTLFLGAAHPATELSEPA